RACSTSGNLPRVGHRYSSRVSAVPAQRGGSSAARRPWPPRLLQLLGGRRSILAARRAGQGDLLVSERRDELELASECGDVAPERVDPALVEALPRLEARDVALIDVGRVGDLHLRL